MTTATTTTTMVYHRYFCSMCYRQYKSEKPALKHNAIKEAGYGMIEKWEYVTPVDPVTGRPIWAQTTCRMV